MKKLRFLPIIPAIILASFYGASSSWSQSCLPRDAATLHSMGSIAISGTGTAATLRFQGFLGDPIAGLFPIPKDLNHNGESDVCEAERIDNVGDQFALPTGAMPLVVPSIEFIDRKSVV